ncbi:1-acyl-sn-glycerol-3-phosphate acyltransferase [Flavobacterium branchiophilum]|uniref:1-acyl-sn-glycerol-3-phosphate acyltransferase n=1 Tax=Flavobacterium branchiophilum TaxID=55197 RepID=A0A543G3X0_9FLAO|nr:1-acyl-sn-glycerol-3-phosphate acyltransferase [Flavobacterium branchiophilum]
MLRYILRFKVQKIISYPISFLALLLFLIALVIFQPIQWVCLRVFGYQTHKKSVDYLNFILVRIGHLLGTTYKVSNRHLIPRGVPIIFVANHQSLYDIVCMIWFLRAWHPKFVSKIELGKGIPSVSFNLKYGGSVLIDRKDPKQAIPTIKKLADYIESNTRSAVIFPEGTRSKTGVPKVFSQTGLKILCKNAPSAFVVPVTINNSWKFVRFGAFPYGLGNKIELLIHEPISVKAHHFESIMEKTENTITKYIKN